MISWNEVERLKREATELGRFTIHVSVVLSLVFSLQGVAVISKKHFTNDLWLDVAAVAGPNLIALYFKNRIALLGVFTYAGSRAPGFGSSRPVRYLMR